MKSIYADFQPYTKKIALEDNFEVHITNKLICDSSISIDVGSYVEIDNEKYEVMELKKENGQIEVYLYKLQRQM